MCKHFIVSFFLIIAFDNSYGNDVITTKLGKIEGFKLNSDGGKEFYNFVGIPFAKPPIGKLRLKKPERMEPWTDTLQAKNYVTCLQYDNILENKILGQEDCLVLNVYTPNPELRDLESLPVMVFIHGGAFYFWSGSNALFGPERLMDYNVVLVTLNYRLGPLGFMSTSDDVMPGNFGLWDQKLALTWVQENIKEFGGNPGKVTIFGNSAGGMSVMYHFLSPQSENLFHGAIAQSGVATSSFLKLDKNPVYYTRSLAARIGCNPTAETEDLLSCLQQVDAAEIQKLNLMFTKLEFFPFVFKPIVDDFSKEPFLPKEPWNMIETGNFSKVPLLIGFNKDDGLLSAFHIHKNHTLFHEMSSKWETEMCPAYVFQREQDELDSEVISICNELSKKFLNGKTRPGKEDILHGYKDLIGDALFNSIGSVTARKIAQKNLSTVYEYMYTHMGSTGFSDLRALKPWQVLVKTIGQFFGLNLYVPSAGCGHVDELFPIFKQHQIPFDTIFTEEDKAVSRTMLKLWTNFASFGDPTPESKDDNVHWLSLGSSNQKRLQIGSEGLQMKLDQNQEDRIEFWTKIWSVLPTTTRYNKSKTWSNPKSYKPLDKVPSKENEEL